jgi:hypothetical protein
MIFHTKWIDNLADAESHLKYLMTEAKTSEQRLTRNRDLVRVLTCGGIAGVAKFGPVHDYPCGFIHPNIVEEFIAKYINIHPAFAKVRYKVVSRSNSQYIRTTCWVVDGQIHPDDIEKIRISVAESLSPYERQIKPRL